MPADYQRELDFMTAALRRMRLQVRFFHPGDSLRQLDGGLRTRLGLEADDSNAYQMAGRWAREKTIYKVLDQFMCNYIYFHLPRAAKPMAVVIGPYLTADPTREQLLEQAERLSIPMQNLPQQEEFYASLPVHADPSALLAIIAAFGEVLWGGAEAFEMVDVNYEQRAGVSTVQAADSPIEQQNILQQMRQMEERYAYENELMDIVAKGLTHRAEAMLFSVSKLNFQQRQADPLRNMKNYCIICNTLLRKAAEQGGVHPLHLDRMSGQYARTIENALTLEAGHALLGDMIRSYSRLVRTHASRQYSAIVHKTLTYIDANLSGDLGLHVIAQNLQVTPGYLSSIFHKETGQTLTGYINDQRMKAAAQLLRNTRLQIQTIAQLCGCSDPNYFSKLFRRCYGMTPGDFRKTQA